MMTRILFVLTATSAGLVAGIPTADATERELQISANGHYFQTSDGARFFYLGDTAWGLFHFTREDAVLYLEDRAAKRFNVIQAIVAPWGGLDDPNPYGEPVFLGGDPAQPNEAYFEHVDWVISQAVARGFFVALVPIWSRSYMSEQAHVLNEETARAFGQFLGRRYRDQPIIWILGGDWFADGYEEEWRAMAAGLAEGDGGAHLMTYHPKSPRSSSQWFHEESWLDFNMLQTGHTILNKNYDLVAEDFVRLPTKPVVDGEGGYEGIAEAFHGAGSYDGVAEAFNSTGLVAQETIAAHDVRRIAYTAAFAGAAGYGYGGHGVWGYRSPPPGSAAGTAGGGAPRHGRAPPFREALQLEAAGQLQYLRALMESRPMLKLVPDQWLIVDDPRGTTERIQACRAEDGSFAFVYTATGADLHLRLIDRIYEKLAGDMLRAWWYDPRSGEATPAGEFPKTIWRSFRPPSSGAGNDWVLVLEDADLDYPAPGTLD